MSNPAHRSDYRERKGKRGQQKVSERFRGLGERRGTADWRSVSQTAIAALVALVTGHGGAVRFGLSRDAGAYSVGLYFEGDHSTVWINAGEDVELKLGEIAQEFVMLVEGDD